MAQTKIKKECGKCGGSGFLSHYRAISAGTCFPCNGKGYILTTQSAINQKEKRKQQKEEKAALMRQWSEKKMNTFLNEFAEDQDFLNKMKGMNPEGNGYQLAFNLMQVFEAQGKFEYTEPKPF
ncbi:hypothetical protein [Metabacillus sp. Hm71]|uniref:hypothetical protein n=1 Tax=Metabacillus sp. Hm71 TaxID=3450743 RepID=UPI003F44259F